MKTMIETALMCMALNIYHEARNQPTIGQLAVGQVVMNRVTDDRYPDDVCSVVKQGTVHKSGHPARDRCQFSWYCDGKDDTALNKEAFERAQENAMIVLNGWAHSLFDGVTHYHADSVTPNWATYKTFVVKINDHIFYRWEHDKR